MNYLSVCSGIEAATVAWRPLGWKAVAYSEIEPFPCAVLKHHFPDTPNWGDMTKFKEWPNANVDVFVGGTPCQSFSIAGLRKGLDDPRGNLMLTYLAIAERYRPRWLVWENVPGVLSSGRGRDFGTFLRALEECGYGWAYATLDAQYFGVPQRRRRVFVVGHFGNWHRAATVLFDAASLRGDPPPRREKRESPASPTGSSVEESSYGLITAPLCHNGRAAGSVTQQDAQNNMLIIDPVAIRTANTGANGHGIAENVAHTLDSGSGKGQAIAIHPHCIGRKPENGPQGKDYLADGSAYTLDATGAAQAVCFENHAQDSRIKECGDISPQINAKAGTGGGNLPLILEPLSFAQNQMGELRTSKTVNTLNTNSNASGRNAPLMLAPEMTVRRLTPKECERLQGFPDNYTLIPYRGKPASDTVRYKALGNSMAVPVMRWIGERIKMVEEIEGENL